VELWRNDSPYSEGTFLNTGVCWQKSDVNLVFYSKARTIIVDKLLNVAFKCSIYKSAKFSTNEVDTGFG